MGKSTIPTEVQHKITEATASLTAAERELEKAMREIASAERADKKIISEVLQTAFDKLEVARKHLDEVLRHHS